MTPDEIRSIVRDELASLGGHLLSQADKPVLSSHPNPAKQLSDQKTLAMLGGYLLEHYGPADNVNVTVNLTPETKAQISRELKERHTRRAAYRDPEPPAVGEPPTTTPGSTE